MRLIIVSNRLPAVIKESEGKIQIEESAGGLVSGLSSYVEQLKSSKSEFLWIGWPGSEIQPKSKDQIINELSKKSLSPVFIDKETMDSFYNGFCNSTIWPLFHYFPSFTKYDETYWESYKKVNDRFADAILEILEPDDIVWIHDYQLMLLPKILREKAPNCQIGFFLHIPFPSFETFRLLPTKWRNQILEGLLGSDLIGFHTQEYNQYFLRCLMRLLGLDNNLGRIIWNDRLVKTDTIPIGVDFDKFYNFEINTDVKSDIDKIKQSDLQKIILSVDRLDYTKGIINRVDGFEFFLQKYPEWHKKVSLMLVAVPSRSDVQMYQQIKKTLDEKISTINGKYGSIEWSPIIYQYKFIPTDTLYSLYKLSDIALVTPLRDGMNLVAKEYIASRQDQSGVLIISEMAGSANELGEAIIINPNNPAETAFAIKEALEMPIEEQIRRNEVMQERLRHYDALHWAKEFLSELSSIKEEQNKFGARFLNSNQILSIMQKYKEGKKRLLLLDYDGTLSEFTISPLSSTPSVQLMDILRKLCADPKNVVIIVSGRNRDHLEKWFGNLNISLVAEQGVWIKEKKQDWQLFKPLRNDWKAGVLPILQLQAARLSGVSIEEKEYSLCWDYRWAEPELAKIRALELAFNLINFTANLDVQVINANKVIEIRNADINKGNVALKWLSKETYDFILAIGNDHNDEELFKVLPDNGISIHVGLEPSHAKFNLKSPKYVFDLLKFLDHDL